MNVNINKVDLHVFTEIFETNYTPSFGGRYWKWGLQESQKSDMASDKVDHLLVNFWLLNSAARLHTRFEQYGFPFSSLKN